MIRQCYALGSHVHVFELHVAYACMEIGTAMLNQAMYTTIWVPTPVSACLDLHLYSSSTLHSASPTSMLKHHNECQLSQLP
jgi:hypothetical protein